MSNRYQGGIVRPGYNPLKVANAPTIGTATAGSTQVSVAFTAPSCVGGGAISSYTAFANCGLYTASGASSPLVVTGLTNGTAYTFKVVATNAFGPSYPSAASNSATPAIVQGQQAYTTAGTYSWVAPTGVTSVSAVVVGGGGNIACNGAGALRYKNNISVTPGSAYDVIVGAAGTTYGCNSYFFSTTTLLAKGGGRATTQYGDGGGCSGTSTGNGGGAGAGGYSGNGGNGANSNSSGTAGSGGGGGGGATYGSIGSCCGWYGGGGGGVGILGQSSNGAAGVRSGTTAGGGGGGSGGVNGNTAINDSANKSGGAYGGSLGTGVAGTGGGTAGGGAVRIIWPGTTRSFPSTNTGNL